MVFWASVSQPRDLGTLTDILISDRGRLSSLNKKSEQDRLQEIVVLQAVHVGNDDSDASLKYLSAPPVLASTPC